jgi:uncharacterized protein DUF6069
MDDPTRPIGGTYERGPAHSPDRPVVDGVRLWVGGLLAGVVAAGVAIVGLLIARGIFDIRVFVPRGDRALFNPSSMWYSGAAFVAAVVATGLLYLLLVATAPAPFAFFSWIVGLATAIAVIVPFTTKAAFESQIATATINLAIGITLLSVLSTVGHSALRTHDADEMAPYRHAA